MFKLFLLDMPTRNGNQVGRVGLNTLSSLWPINQLPFLVGMALIPWPGCVGHGHFQPIERWMKCDRRRKWMKYGVGAGCFHRPAPNLQFGQ